MPHAPSAMFELHAAFPATSEALGDLAHRLAGAAAIIGAAAAEGHCRALQRICEGDGEGLEARLGQADAALAELQRALADWLARAAG